MHDELTTSIRLLNSLAQKLKAGRMAAGALNLASPEVKIHMDSAESSDPIDVEQKEMRETNSLVEEFMLLANISVAREIQGTFPQTAVLRSVVYRVIRVARLTSFFLAKTAFSTPTNKFRESSGHLAKAERVEFGRVKLRCSGCFT